MVNVYLVIGNHRWEKAHDPYTAMENWLKAHHWEPIAYATLSEPATATLWQFEVDSIDDVTVDEMGRISVPQGAPVEQFDLKIEDMMRSFEEVSKAYEAAELSAETALGELFDKSGFTY